MSATEKRKPSDLSLYGTWNICGSGIGIVSYEFQLTGPLSLVSLARSIEELLE
jgi:hypothetical protein